jgi:ferredoxin
MFTCHVCKYCLSEVYEIFTKADDRLTEVSKLFLSAGNRSLSIEMGLVFCQVRESSKFESCDREATLNNFN